MHIEKKSDKCKIKRAKAIIQVKETIMQKVKDKIIPIILIAIMAVSGYKIVTYFYQAHEQKKIFTSIEKKIDNNQKGLVKAKGNNIQKKYAKLYEENSDFVGWIKIKGTKINYPVMKTTKPYDFYVMHNFKKEDSIYGTPFVGEKCSVDPMDFNTIIYGHHMKNGTMFSDLIKYKNVDFYKEHKYVQFDTIKDSGKYLVVYAFVSEVNVKKSFEYYNVAYWSGKKKINKYINEISKRSLYNTNEKITYKDKIISLSTCENTNENSRMVIVCKKIK